MTKKKLTTEQFISKAKVVHGDKYDYSKTLYTSRQNKLIIICSEHGEFEQLAGNHLNGAGCSYCRYKNNSLNFKYNTEQFIKKAGKTHKNKYDYSKVNYITAHHKVIITCPIHGDFQQEPGKHIYGRGCPVCGGTYKKSSDQFIEKAKAVHGNNYDYINVNYINSKTKIDIKCKKHGNFKQNPRDHLKGAGCPICKASKGELIIKEILDKYSVKYIQEYKIPEVVNQLYYDFYLPEHNLLIEFHGIQHFEYNDFFHRNGEDDFLKQKNRDDIVRDNARYFKYRYLEFNYRQLKKLSKEHFEEMLMKKILRKYIK